MLNPFTWKLIDFSCWILCTESFKLFGWKRLKSVEFTFEFGFRFKLIRFLFDAFVDVFVAVAPTVVAVFYIVLTLLSMCVFQLLQVFLLFLNMFMSSLKLLNCELLGVLWVNFGTLVSLLLIWFDILTLEFIMVFGRPAD